MFTSFRKGKLGATLCMLGMMTVALAAQTLSYTITKPTGYEDGTAFGTEQLVYLVYNADNDQQLFSTFNLTGTVTTLPDGVTCIYAKAGIYNLTANNVLAGTLSDPSPSSCKAAPPAPTAKKVGKPGIKWN